MNDRSLRSIVIGLGGGGANGVMREDGFEITAASEVMAVLCLARNLEDLKERLGRIVVGYDSLHKPVLARDVGAPGAMAALLRDAIHPNLVQTIEGVPAFVHGGPFANIAHGCNTVLATRLALKLADYVVTEAGFGADLGAEKFFHIKCRSAGLAPRGVVLVVTRRAYAVHGLDNVLQHVRSVRAFGMPVVVSINRFLDDADPDLEDIRRALLDAEVPAVVTDFREGGGRGGVQLAEAVREQCQTPSELRFLYDLEAPLRDKIEAIATQIYGAAGVELTQEARQQLGKLQDLGYGRLPVCMAKTPASLSDDPKLSGCPRDFTITVTSAKVSAGAGFVVVYTGKVMTMPGLPKVPAARGIDVEANGSITGLF